MVAISSVAVTPISHEDAEQPLLQRAVIGDGAEDRADDGDDRDRDRRRPGKARRWPSVGGRPGGRVVAEERREDRHDDRGPERRVRPVVHRPGAQLGAAQAEAREQALLTLRTSSAPPTRGAANRRRRTWLPPCRSRSCLTSAASDAWMLDGPPSRWRARVSADSSSRPSCSTTARSTARWASVSRCQIASNIVSCSASSRASVACRLSSVARRPPASRTSSQVSCASRCTS